VISIDTAANIGVITEDAANHVLWQFDHGGMQPGAFNTALYSTIAKADPENRDRLAKVFPVQVAAYKIAADHPDGIDILGTIAGGDSR
jgi:hypothetical protein